uniref:ATP synthase F0 subunit 8 n=1 Tax=Hygia lativentris TaxID=763191 RepID=UPI002E75BEAC|nr:ATP synthase F0 subunit 8 [Hygia lativentris]WPV77640.1 ATP synthase F0 subunit 8 [Hygia lativentris]
MPQMSPLWWEILYIMFLLMFMIIIMIIYYNKEFNPQNNLNKKMKLCQFKWKW